MGAPVAVGIDVGAEHLHVIGVDDKGGLVHVDVVRPSDLSPLLPQLADDACVAIDAPDEQRVPCHVDDLALGRKFRTARCAEIALGRQRGYWVPWVTPPLGEEVTPWMATGFDVWRTIRGAGLQPIEVFPYAGFRALAGGVRLAKKRTPLGAAQRTQLLEAAGLPLAATATHDLRDAAVAAVIARDAAHGVADEVRCTDIDREHDGSAMWLPAALTEPPVLAAVPAPDTLASPRQAGALAMAERAPCLCGCGLVPKGRRSRFMPGHDQRKNPATGRAWNRG